MNTQYSTKGNDERKVHSVFIRSMLNQKVILSITEIGNNLKQNLEKKLIHKNEGKCITEGYIRPNSIKIIQFSSGLINNENIEFQTVFECMLCYPVEGMLIECNTRTITKAGIHAEVILEDGIVPITVFVARDHHNTSKYFASIKENMKILTKVIGVRFELNDPYICVISSLIDPDASTSNRGGNRTENKPKLQILGNDSDDDDDEE
jgi:DNA-directed RNA polymerase subunit E'/Rpb7